MRNWKSFFSKEDFPIELGDERAQEIADKANALLIEALNQAEPVYGRGPYGTAWYLKHAVGALDFDSQRKGRVVDVEDLSDEEFEQHREQLKEIGLKRTEPWFDKHNLMLELGETNAIVDLLGNEKVKGFTKTPVRELNEGLRGGLRDGEVTFVAGSGHLEEVLSVITLTAFQHGHKVLRVIDGATDHIGRDRFPRAIELYKFASFDMESIETELLDFIKETHATFVVIDRLDVDGFFFKENRTADDFRKVMNAIRLAAETTKAHIVFSAIAINVARYEFEELSIPVIELSNNVILFDKDDRGQEHFIEIKKCSHEIPFGRIHAEFKCLKPFEWNAVLAPTKWSEIED